MTGACQRCPSLERQLNAARIDLDNANTDLTAKRREITRLKGIAGERKAKDNADVRDVLDYWQAAYPEHASKLVAPDGARYKRVAKVMAAGCTAQDCKRAIDGSKDNPWNQGANKDRQPLTDIQHILADDAMVERNRDRALGRLKHGYQGPKGVTAILERLDGVKRQRDGQWDARCPAHDDQHSSLQVGQGEKGAVISCQAGCPTDRVLSAINLPMAALFDSEQHTPPSAPAVRLPSINQLQEWHRNLLGHAELQERIRAAKGWMLPTLRHFGIGWETSEKRLMIPSFAADAELRSVVRYRPKSDEKMKAWPGSKRDLFPLPETLPTPIMWLLEGEPDGVSGFEYGFPAIAIPGVGFATKVDQWAPRLKDRRVVVCFDCDDAGREASERVCHALTKTARDVRNLDLDSSRSDGWDLSDALLEGVTGYELRHRAQASASVSRFAA